MKRMLSVILGLSISGAAVAQEKEVTNVTTKTTTVAGGADLLGPPLWTIQDATPVPAGSVNLRVGVKWSTASAPANGGNSDDDFVIIPHVVIGLVDNVELAVGTSAWLGDSGDVGPMRDGNYDSNVGVLWRFFQQDGFIPSMAVLGGMRVPTGDGSSGVDGEFRLIFTNEYDSGIRSHINLIGITANGNNDESTRYKVSNPYNAWEDGKFANNRHWQWGVVVGLDGPLCSDGAVRWVGDYVHRSSYHYGTRNINLLELGWEWAIAEGHSLGMSTQIGLDDNGDTPNFGAGFTYSYRIAQ